MHEPAMPSHATAGHAKRARGKRNHAHSGGQKESAAKLARKAAAEPDDSWMN